MPATHRVYDTPLAAKLGVTQGGRSLVVGPAPQGVLDQLPQVHRRPGAAAYDVIVAFCPDMVALTSRTQALVGRTNGAGSLWLCWPKRSSGVATDVGEAEVRDAGLQAGLVDVKIAAIDAVWSGLRFVRRRADR